MKWLLKMVGALLVLVVIAVFAGVIYMDSVVKTTVETVGPKVTQSPVTLDNVGLSLLAGSASLSGLKVGNPEGFAAPHAFSLGRVDVKLNRDSLFTDTVVVESVRILAPEVTFENSKSGSNIRALQRNVEQAMAPEGQTSPAATTAEAGGKTLIIKDLLISGGKLHYSNPLLTGKTLELPLSDIHLTGIGESSNGVSASEVAGQVLSALNQAAAQAMAQSGAVSDLRLRAKETLNTEKDKLKDMLGGLKGQRDTESEN